MIHHTIGICEKLSKMVQKSSHKKTKKWRFWSPDNFLRLFHQNDAKKTSTSQRTLAFYRTPKTWTTRPYWWPKTRKLASKKTNSWHTKKSIYLLQLKKNDKKYYQKIKIASTIARNRGRWLHQKSQAAPTTPSRIAKQKLSQKNTKT